MKVGDLVTGDFYEEVGIVVSQPRLSTDQDLAVLGVMSGDIYEVVDVLHSDGMVRTHTVGELKVLSESR